MAIHSKGFVQFDNPANLQKPETQHNEDTSLAQLKKALQTCSTAHAALVLIKKWLEKNPEQAKQLTAHFTTSEISECPPK